MKLWHFYGLVTLLFVQGCTILSKEQRLYEVKLKSGLMLYAQGQPKKDADDFYRFSDVNDQAYSVEDNSILYIKPVKFKK